MRKRVVVGADDSYPAAVEAADYLARKGYEVIRTGALATGKTEPWPEVAASVGRMVAWREAEWGLLVCYTGTGVSIASNKIRGVRAALCSDAQTARGARLWNDANVLALSGRLTTPEVAREIIDAWIAVERPDESEKENIERLKRLEEER